MYREGTCVRVYSTQNQTSTTLFKRKINEKYTFGIYIFIYVLLINAKSPLLDYIYVLLGTLLDSLPFGRCFFLTCTYMARTYLLYIFNVVCVPYLR